MSYRKFLSLLGGLSPNSALSNVCNALKDEGVNDTSNDDPAAAERALRRAWGIKK